jgi:hypothetical protein
MRKSFQTDRQTEKFKNAGKMIPQSIIIWHQTVMIHYKNQPQAGDTRRHYPESLDKRRI